MPKYAYGFTFEVEDDAQARAVAEFIRVTLQQATPLQNLTSEFVPERLAREDLIPVYHFVNEGEQK